MPPAFGAVTDVVGRNATIMVVVVTARYGRLSLFAAL